MFEKYIPVTGCGEIPDAKQDKKGAKRVGQYKISGRSAERLNRGIAEKMRLMCMENSDTDEYVGFGMSNCRMRRKEEM